MTELPPATPKRILVIDDVAELRELAQTVLQEEGFVVELAQDAAEGGLKLLATKPDLVILDLMMPGVDGFKFLEYVRATTSDPPPVVFLSGGRTAESALKGLGLGAFAFLAKPVNFKTLVETCHAALARPVAAIAPGDPAERRAHARRAVLVQVQLAAGDAEKGPVLGEMTELSAGGAAVISLADFTIGARVHVMPDPRIFHHTAPLIAEVRSRSEVDTGFRYGIEFVGLDPGMERLLREHLIPAVS